MRDEKRKKNSFEMNKKKAKSRVVFSETGYKLEIAVCCTV